ncbi:putative RNA-directed DNA polymerase [Tanacetum coccineum]
MASNKTLVNVSQPQIPIFKGDSYEFWSIKMKTLFKSQDLWEFVESGLPEETATSSKHAWDTLKTEYQGSAKVISVKLQSLLKNFETTSMKNDETVQGFLAKVSMIVSQMRAYGDNITDETVVAKILRSLPPKFDHVVAAIEESKYISTLSFDEFMGSLQAHEVRINRIVAREDEQAFQTTEDAEPSKRNQYTRGRGRGSYRGRGRGRTNLIYCSHCDKNGHSDDSCWFKPESAKFAEKEDKEEDEFLFMTLSEINKPINEVWYIDSGFSHHMTGDKSRFKLLDETIKSKVLLGNDIPAGANEANIWKAFAKQGRVCDVYLAKKKTINGSNFGVARFLNLSNPKSFEKILNSTTTLGHHRLKVNIARYQRGFANSDHHSKLPNPTLVTLPTPTTIQTILRCNRRLTNNPSLNPSPSPHDYEVRKTIEVGTTLGYNLTGHEVKVSDLIDSDFFINSFIYNAKLIDLPMGGRRFTRMNKFATKLSKLDRILVSRQFTSKWPNAQLITLPRDVSDHCPLLHKSHCDNFGPIPFKFFNSWLLNDEFPTIFSQSWSSTLMSSATTHPAIILKEKLQLMKKHIRMWRSNATSNSDNLIQDLKDKVEVLDAKAENGCLVNHETETRISLLKQLEDQNHIKRLDLMQKAKIKWEIEDDENSKLFSWAHKQLQKVVHSVVNEVQTAYIKGRQIIDGPLMVNEIISCASKKNERLFLFKVDFEKAFDSLDWNFLDNVMQQMGFSHKWRNLICGCLTSSFSSVIVNGSPTKEFDIQCGLRQVDISHLQFVDDALILGKWSLENARTLCHILRCFTLASGLKVNFSKSKLFGVGVNATEIQSFANILDSQASTFPCSYLRLPIGANMSKACNWKPIIEKFHKRLTSWKARNLSYGGRLTLLKSVLGALGTYFFSLFLAPKRVINYLEKLRRNFFWGVTLDCNKMAWIGWKNVCSSYSCGGLGIGNLHAANLAMLIKWWWRFHTEKNTLWKDIIISIHGLTGGYGSIPARSAPLSPWKTIICLDKQLSCANISLESIFIRQVRDGSLFRFWLDKWIGAVTLKTMFPRLFSMELHKQCTNRDIFSSNNGFQQFNFKWRRPIRNGPEATQLNGLLDLLSDFVIVDTLDHWACSFISSKMYR